MSEHEIKIQNNNWRSNKKVSDFLSQILKGVGGFIGGESLIIKIDREATLCDAIGGLNEILEILSKSHETIHEFDDEDTDLDDEDEDDDEDDDDDDEEDEDDDGDGSSGVDVDADTTWMENAYEAATPNEEQA